MKTAVVRRILLAHCALVKSKRFYRGDLQHTEQSICTTKWRAVDGALEDRQLLSQGQIFERDGAMSAGDQRERSEQYDERGRRELSSRATEPAPRR